VEVYGARPVSLDLARSRTLSRPVSWTAGGSSARTRPGPRRLEVLSAVDRLSLAHWPAGQRIAVCSLDGGVGRTTVAGLLAVVLAELPYADAWPPVGLIDTDLNPFSGTPARWAAVSTNPHIRRLDLQPESLTFGDHDVNAARVVVVDTAGPPMRLPWLTADPDTMDPGTVVVMVCRPEPACLTRMAEALTALHDLRDLHRARVVVLVNDGVGECSRLSATLTTALSIRCAAVHRLPATRQLADTVLPTGPRLGRRLRERIAAVAVSLWKQTDLPHRPGQAATPIDDEETR
jgi:hypothetical protein